MKRLITILLCVWALVMTTSAQVEHEDVLHIGYGGQWMTDAYLSPLLYEGQQIEIGNEWWQGFRKAANWQHVGAVNLIGGRSISERKSNTILNLDINGGWGAHYVWQWDTGAHKGLTASGLNILVGPYLDFDFMAKEMSRNTNKPYSFDVGLDVQAMAGIAYSFRAKKTAYRLRYLVRYNLAGIEWQQDYWESYYEVTEGVNVSGSVKPSYFVNRQNLTEELTLDMQFKRSTWRVGVRHHYLHYGTDDMPFMRQTVSAVVGVVFNYKVEGKALTNNL